jgi:SHS2 domain-containing protein
VTAAAGYDYFDVAADVGVRAWGPTLPEAFAQAGLGVFALLVDLAAVEPRDTREVRAQAESREGLLVNWLNECLLLHDIEGFVARRIEFSLFEEGRVHSFLRGEEVDPSRHRVGTVVKAATMHEVQVRESRGGWEARVILDI